MSFVITDVQICGFSGRVFTDDANPQIAVFTDGGRCIKKEIKVIHGAVTDWEASFEEGHYFRYEGRDLLPKTSYKVLVTAFTDTEKAVSAAQFDTGFMGGSWEAAWIEPRQEAAVPEPEVPFFKIFSLKTDGGPDEEKLRPAQEIRKTFRLESVPESAVLYATAHGVYDVRLNGQEVSDRKLQPEISVYPKCLYYQRYDVGGYLKKGENELLFTVADGWYCGRIGLTGDSCQYGDRLGLLAQLETGGPDNKILAATDSSFEGRASYIRYSDLYIGEKWDLTAKAGGWEPVSTAEFAFDNLEAQELTPLKVTDTLEGRLFRSPDGSLMADFGRTMAGRVRLGLNCGGPRSVLLEHCEVLDKNGDFCRNIMGRNKQQNDVLICGAGEVAFAPRFTYHGFRYVRISGIDIEEIKYIKADVIGTPIYFHGGFGCSDVRLEKLQDNIRHSMESNFFSIPTDCPQREKMGWTGDIQIFSDTACFNADVRGFLKVWLKNMRLEQRADGEIPNYVPAFPITDMVQRRSQGSNTSSAWGDACILVPLSVYRATGDRSVLTDNLSMMERWLGYIDGVRKRVPDDFESFDDAKKERQQYLWHGRPGEYYGDWLIPSLQEVEGGVYKGKMATGNAVSAAFYAVTLQAYLDVMEALEGTQYYSKEKYSAAVELLAKVRDAVRAEYVNPDGSVAGNFQGLYVIMLHGEIVTGELAGLLAGRLADMIKDNGWRLDTGFVTTPWLLEELCRYGYTDVAYRLLFQEEQPSWLYQVKMGATSIWENWTAVKPDGTPAVSSMNHYSLGSVGAWMYRHIGGLKLEDAGRRVVFSPDTDRETSSGSAYTRHPDGMTALRWRKHDGRVYMEIKSPVPCTVEIQDSQVSLPEGSYLLIKDDLKMLIKERIDNVGKEGSGAGQQDGHDAGAGAFGEYVAAADVFTADPVSVQYS